MCPSLTTQRANVFLAILIPVLVVTLIIPMVKNNRDQADTAITMGRLKDLTWALHACDNSHRKLPPAFDRFARMEYPASVHVHLLPYVQQDALYREFLGRGKVDGKLAIQPFVVPTDPSASTHEGVQSFAANLRVFSDKGYNTALDKDMPAVAALEPGSASISESFPRGTSTSVVFATKFATCGEGGSGYAADPTSPWAAFFGQNIARIPAHPSDPRATFQLAPATAECLASPLMAQSHWRSGILLSMADGMVRFVRPSVKAATWNIILQH